MGALTVAIAAVVVFAIALLLAGIAKPINSILHSLSEGVAAITDQEKDDLAREASVRQAGLA